MSLTVKISVIIASGGLLGATTGLWAMFGGEVYLAYLSGIMMRCF